MNPLLRFYLTIRKPRNFLKLLCLFIGTSLTLHWLRGYDHEWGSTNLILSIEATVAGAVMLMVQEESAQLIEKMLERIIALEEMVLASEDRILKVLTEGESNGMARDGDGPRQAV